MQDHILGSEFVAEQAKVKRPFPHPGGEWLTKCRQPIRVRHAGRWTPAAPISVTLRVVTPILGGSYRTRQIDKIDVIRAPTVRAHLRFWWRALYAHRYDTANELWEAERALWGGAAEKGRGGRSAVEIAISRPTVEGVIDNQQLGMNNPGAYALWPARQPHADRRRPGTEYRLTLTAPRGGAADEVKAALTAWILFGGYGGRTRRGLGSLTVVESYAGEWLPTTASPEELQAVFGDENVFDGQGEAKETPSLAGGALFVGRTFTPKDNTNAAILRAADGAWIEALSWLRDFRQGQPPNAVATVDDFARIYGTPQRPKRSNWPEADKVRQLSPPPATGRWAHPPRHNADPAWTRAGFGLPVLGRFQQKSRTPHPHEDDTIRWDQLPSTDLNYGNEPGPYELRWGVGAKVHDRLASPLIVKALPLANGQFVSCAIWLRRAMPQHAKVGLYNRHTKSLRHTAPFERDGATYPLLAPGDAPLFKPLAKSTLRDAFLDWLRKKPGVTVVAP